MCSLLIWDFFHLIFKPITFFGILGPNLLVQRSRLNISYQPVEDFSNKNCSVADLDPDSMGSLDLDSMGSLDPDSYSQSGRIRIQEGKNDPQKWKKFINIFFVVLDVLF